MNVIAFTGARMQLTVNSSGYGLSFEHAEEREDRVKRLMGCLFISFMPSAGLDETISTLNDYYEYYEPEIQTALPEPATELKGKVVEAGASPSFLVVE